MKIIARRAWLSTLVYAAGLVAVTVLPSLAAADILGILKQPGSVYREAKVNPPCSAGTCYLDFAPVPVGKILEIDLITCFAIFEGQFSRGFTVTIKSGNQVAFIPSVLEGTNGSFTYASGALNGPLFFRAGEQMRILVFDTPGDPFCSVSGYLYAKQ
jgi:hypothetical protein